MRKLILIIPVALILSSCFSYKVQRGELGQNWNREDQRSFYYTSQGSQLLKYDWFLALEQASNNRLFLDYNLQRFGYLPDPFASSRSADNSHLLPIGFVKDVGTGYIGENEVEGPWIGMTCAACHTAEMEISGKTHLIDGAPTDADFYAFISGLSDSLAATVNDSSKFSRFALRVGDSDSLRAELEQTANRFSTFVQQSTPAHAWGKARLDAVGLILNTVAHRLVPEINASYPDAKPRDDDLGHLDKRDPVRPRKDNTHQPNAPVSYPFLWDTYQQPHNQWNGVSVATLSRNTTEVLGVFATFDPDEPKNNSVKFGALKELQGLVANLRSPRWNNPEYDLPAIDDERVTRGEVLYRNNCQDCHEVFDREEDQVRSVHIVLNGIDVVGTDGVMAENFVDHTFALEEGKQLVHAKDLVATALLRVWRKSIFGALLYGGIEEIVNGFFFRITEDLEVYKGRPLNGIWATAPYLHNGSIPNMEELLKSPDERVKIFCVGSRIFDPVTLGFESDVDAAGECGNNFKLDTNIGGNHNTGHDSYDRRPFTEEERLDIIEFIKSE